MEILLRGEPGAELAALLEGAGHRVRTTPPGAGEPPLDWVLHPAAATPCDPADTARLVGELERTNQELREFAYVVSHDLKAPLRAIDSLVNWIAADYADSFDEDGKEQMDLLLGRVRRMQNLIEGVLQYSRVGRLHEEPAPVNLTRLLAEVLDALAPPAHIVITRPDRLPVVVGERTRLYQLFQNLISNAIKYMDKSDGLVDISCQLEGAWWRLAVRDNGPGIDPKDHERIFQIFQTLHAKDEYESTGIGLTLVKKIVELHGGRVWVESQLGRGSTFFFTLPATGETV